MGAGTTDSLTFNNDEGNITIIANQDNFSKSDKSITEKASVKAKLIPNNNTNKAHETYNIFLVVENNDLVYTKNNSTPELLLKITDPNNGEYTETVDGLQYYENVTDREDTKHQGYDITTSDNQVYKIVSNYAIDAEEATGTEQTWQVEATLVNLDQDQNANTGKTFEGSIYITTEDNLELSEINTLKTIATTTSIEAVADITTGTSDIATYYFAIEETSETPETIKLSSIAKALEHDYSEETSSTHTFSDNILENKNYKIYTYAIDEKGYKSNIYETVVTAKDGAIPEVGEYTTSVTPSSITITYSNNDVLNYHAKIDGGEWTDYDKATNTITGLKENTTYKILIQAKNDDGVVSNVKVVKVTTGEIPKPKLSEFVISKVGDSGDGVLAEHTLELPNSAGDNSYRYSGNNPNNFVCFGAGSEEYNNGGTTCPDTNLYRIIGLFPFNEDNRQLKDGTQATKYLVKLIKSEYLTKEELGKSEKDGAPFVAENYKTFKRTVRDISNIDGFFWNANEFPNWSVETVDVKYNLWQYDGQKSTLNEALNTNYLNTLNNSEHGGIDWRKKIENVYWNIIGGTLPEVYSVSPSGAFNSEISATTEGNIASPQATVQAPIGLMYLSDYGFAAKNVNDLWTKTIGYGYDCDDNRQNNWLLNFINEWTITRESSNTNYAWRVDAAGWVGDYYVQTNAYGVRPTFYLTSDIQVKDDGSIGNASNPFRIVI